MTDQTDSIRPPGFITAFIVVGAIIQHRSYNIKNATAQVTTKPSDLHSIFEFGPLLWIGRTMATMRFMGGAQAVSADEINVMALQRASCVSEAAADKANIKVHAANRTHYSR